LVVGGLIVCVAVPLVLAFGPYEDDPGSKVPAYASVVTVAFYIFAIFAMQIRSLKAAPAGQRYEEPEQRAVGPNDPPLGWTALSAAMALTASDEAGQQLAGETLKRGVGRQLWLGVGLMVCVIGGMLAWLSGAPAWVFAPAFIFVLLLAGTVRGMMGIAGAVSAPWLRPLGLTMTEMPRSQTGIDAMGRPRHTVVGSTVMTGTRHGRPVRIDLDGRNYETRVNGKFARLDISSTDGKLAASDDSPDAIRQLADSLTPDERWKEISVRSRGDGITVRRKKVNLDDAMLAPWLDDLWLAEEVARRAGR